MTVLPKMMLHFDISREKSIAAVEKAMVGDQKVCLVTQRNPEETDPGIEDLYQVGTVALIKQLVKLPNNVIRVMVEGLERTELLTLESEEPLLVGEIEELQVPMDILDPVTIQQWLRL